jgi:hypothetical protein
VIRRGTFTGEFSATVAGGPLNAPHPGPGGAGVTPTGVVSG